MGRKVARDALAVRERQEGPDARGEHSANKEQTSVHVAGCIQRGRQRAICRRSGDTHA